MAINKFSQVSTCKYIFKLHLTLLPPPHLEPAFVVCAFFEIIPEKETVLGINGHQDFLNSFRFFLNFRMDGIQLSEPAPTMAQTILMSTDSCGF